VTQSRHDMFWEYVKTYTCQVSNSTDGPWHDVGMPTWHFSGSVSRRQKEGRFPAMTVARYVKILPQTWGAWISMRAGLRICEDAEHVISMAKAEPGVTAPAWNECTYMNFNPPERFRTYSSIYNDDCPGTGHGASMLNSVQAWSSKWLADGSWITVDLGVVTWAIGVITQSRADRPWELVDHFNMHYSEDGSSWYLIQKVFVASDKHKWLKVDLFPEMIKARYLKFVIRTWKYWISLRTAILLCGHTPKPALLQNQLTEFNVNEWNTTKPAKQMLQIAQ